MDALFTIHPHGLFLRREALDFGYLDRDLVAARRAGVLTRIRHGAYVSSTVWDVSDALQRHRLHAQAVMLTHPGTVALSHVSGAVEHGLRLFRPDLSRTHVTRLDGAVGRHSPDIVYHRDTWTPNDVYLKGELLVLGPETCALGAAALTTIEAGLCVLDSVIDLDLGSLDSLWTTYLRRAGWPHTRKLQVTLRLVRVGAQSVGESRSRYLFWTQHLPEPQLQWHVYDETGRLIGITDFAWPDFRLLGEFDGKVKFGKLLRPGEDPTDAVFREKRREDMLREVSRWQMIRYIEADLWRPDIAAARTRRMLGLAAA